MKNFTIFTVILAVISLVISAWINYPVQCAVTSAIILAFMLYQLKKAPLMPADYNLD